MKTLNFVLILVLAAVFAATFEAVRASGWHLLDAFVVGVLLTNLLNWRDDIVREERS